MSTSGREAPPRRVPLHHRLCVLGVLLLWHLPVLYHGLISTHRLPGVPWNLHRCHDIACLFDQTPVARHHFYVQVRTTARPDWTTVDVDEFFPMQPFGYRSRFERLVSTWGESPRPAHHELAAWLFQRQRERHPEAPAWTELRFLWTWVDLAEDPPPQGAARQPPAESFPFDRRQVLSVHKPEDP